MGNLAVTYMLALEKEPETYEKLFTRLTKGINQKIQNWIVEKIPSQSCVLEIGCGPGTLSLKIAEKSCEVVGIDLNPRMIEQAIQNIPQDSNLNLSFQEGSALHLPSELGLFDVIVMYLYAF